MASTSSSQNNVHDYLVSDVNRDAIFSDTPISSSSSSSWSLTTGKKTQSSTPPPTPDFHFLDDALHDKLWHMSDRILSDYITHLEDITPTFTKTGVSKPSASIVGETSLINLHAMFYSAVRPDIPNTTYIRMVVRRMPLPSYVYVLSFVYLQRVHDKQMSLGYLTMKVSKDNMHRLFVTACYVAARVLAPTLGHVTKERCARAGGLKSADEVKRLVKAFDVLIEKDYDVTKETFKQMVERLFVE